MVLLREINLRSINSKLGDNFENYYNNICEKQYTQEVFAIHWEENGRKDIRDIKSAKPIECDYLGDLLLRGEKSYSNSAVIHKVTEQKKEYDVGNIIFK